MIADLVQRITAAIDEAEKLATACVEPDDQEERWLEADDPTGALDCVEDEDAACIAAWSPDRVQALVDADRQLLSYVIDLHNGVFAESVRGIDQSARVGQTLLENLAARWGVTP
jgi:hypothetical protein